MSIKLSSLKPNPDNPRLIKDSRFKKLVQSIKEFPKMMELRPIVIDKTKVIIGGNMRYKALLELGETEVPEAWVKRAEELTEEERRRFIISDNNQFGENDWDQLANGWDLGELQDWGLEIPGFALKGADVVDDDFEMPDSIETDIVPGDRFEIGDHRLLCGSSTESAAVAKLLGGKEPYLMVTDPPYGVNYTPEWRDGIDGKRDGTKSPGRSRGKVSNDDNADWTEAWALSPAKVAYIWHAGVYAATVSDSLKAADFIIRSQIIWVKSSLVFGRGNYHWQHEPCWYAVKKGNKGNWCGDHKQSTTWDIQSLHATRGQVDDGKTIHSTQKPVECMARPIRNHDGDVYDPFLGSGTTMATYTIRSWDQEPRWSRPTS